MLLLQKKSKQSRSAADVAQYPASKKSFTTLLKNNWQLYVLVLPAILYFLIFNYLPMYGVQIAFRDYKAVRGIMGSEWVGLKHFRTFFDAYYFKRLLVNTLLLNVYNLLWSFPMPLILALFLNRIRSDQRKRFIQTTIYVPYFISTVVLAGMLYIFLSPTIGIFNIVIKALGFEAIDFMSQASAFRTIYIVSGIWQGAGYNSILYIACLAGVDTSLYEAADMDGASIWQKMFYIDIPSLIPTAMMTFILNSGKMFASNTNKALVMQTAGNVSTSDIIGVYVYNMGLAGGQFSYTAAIGLFTNVVNFILIITVNKISKTVSSIGLF